MGLQANDLKDLVFRIFEVDSYKSKMGEDKDIVVLSFRCMTEASARDLENFIEKGYPHVLDADVSSGEQSDGTYKVFVELERMKDVPKQIFEIVDGVKLLTGIPEMKFRYYKSFKSMPAEEGILGETIPLDKDSYEIKVNENPMENYKHFLNRSYVDSIDVINETLIFQKKWAEPIKFEILDFGTKEQIGKTIKESYNSNSFAEVIFLTKYIGDYDIHKYGEKFLIDEKDHTLVLKRQ